MSDSPWLRGCVTAMLVAIVLYVLRRAGPRCGGLAAAVPVTSVPALAWMTWERGSNFAAASATAALLTTATTGFFALLYAVGARRGSALRTLLCATGPAVALTGAVAGLASNLASALGGAVLLLAICARLLPAATTTHRRAARWHRDVVLTMLVSGAFTTLISLISPRVPPQLCGLVAAIPVIGMSTTVSVHVQSGHMAVVTFLRAYLQGLMSKVAFLGALAWLLPRDLGPAAWLGATMCGVAVLLALSSRRVSALRLPASPLAGLPAAPSPQSPRSLS
jgi:hypothetical protein